MCRVLDKLCDRLFVSELKLKTIKARQAEAESLFDLSGKFFWLAIGNLVVLAVKEPESLTGEHGNAYFIAVILVFGVCVLLSICLRRQALIRIDRIHNP